LVEGVQEIWFCLDLPVVVPTPIAPPVMEKTEAEERKSRQDQLAASEKRNLSPYKVLPEIPSKSKSKESESKVSDAGIRL